VTYDQNNARCAVFTFKEGLLSPIAHDLRLLVQRFTIEIAASIVARFDATSLTVDTAMKDGRDNPSALSDADKAKIAGQIRDDVLHSQRYPEISFRSREQRSRSDGGYDLSGELTLHGVTRPLECQTTLSDGRQCLSLTLHQPDFGIAPYRAMLGTLKIQPDVRIELVA
jgi:polyisoprenoid-binding protein YceI